MYDISKRFLSHKDLGHDHRDAYSILVILYLHECTMDEVKCLVPQVESFKAIATRPAPTSSGILHRRHPYTFRSVFIYRTSYISTSQGNVNTSPSLPLVPCSNYHLPHNHLHHPSHGHYATMIPLHPLFHSIARPS